MDHYKHIHVALGVVLRKDHVLLTKRAPGQIMEGFWEFPGGKLEPGESAAEAAVRELKEEVDILVTPWRVLPPFYHTYPHGKVCLYPVYCDLQSGTPAAIEVAEFAWAKASELKNYRMLKGNTDIAKKIVADMQANA